MVDTWEERATFLRKDPSQVVKGAPPNFGDTLIPHVVTFQGILASISKVYRASDEALKDSYANARYMLNDLTIMECVEQRQRSTALLDWHLEIDDDKDLVQKALKDNLTAILRRLPRFMQYREALLRAIWYGKYGVQHRYRWQDIEGKNRVVVDHWLPVHGDKLVFGFDDGGELAEKVGIRTGPGLATGGAASKAWCERSRNKIQPTDYGLAYFLDPWERDLLAIHKHLIEDGEFEEPVNAGRIHGLGIRSRIYWTWFQKQELLAWLMEYLERSSFGIEIWYYPWGNDQAREEMRTAAEERIGQGRNIILVPKPMGEEGMAYGVQRIEPGMAGAESAKDILVSYFGHLIKRYIIGQTLTTEAENTGLGSNLGAIQLETYVQIIKYDATNLQETLTTDLVDRLKAFNFPQFEEIPVRFVIETETADVEAKLEAWLKAFEMGCRLKEQDVMDLIGAAMPEEGDKALEQQQQQPGFGPELGGGQGAPLVPFAQREAYAKEWDEGKHPRVDKGSSKGGQFGAGGGTEGQEDPSEMRAPSASEIERHWSHVELHQRLSSKIQKSTAAFGEKGAAYTKAASSVFDYMTAKALRRFEANVRGFHWYPDTNRLTESMDAIGVIIKRGARIGGACEGRMGSHEVRLHLDGGTDLGDKYPETMRHVYAHEFSHAIDESPGEYRISQRPKWREAWQKEIVEGDLELSQYSKTNAREGFAEFGRLAFTNPKQARTVYPACWAIWKKEGLV